MKFPSFFFFWGGGGATFNCFLDWKIPWTSSRLEVARQSYPGAALAFLSRCVTWKMFYAWGAGCLQEPIFPQWWADLIIIFYLMIFFKILGDIVIHDTYNSFNDILAISWWFLNLWWYKHYYRNEIWYNTKLESFFGLFEPLTPLHTFDSPRYLGFKLLQVYIWVFPNIGDFPC